MVTRVPFRSVLEILPDRVEERQRGEGKDREKKRKRKKKKNTRLRMLHPSRVATQHTIYTTWRGIEEEGKEKYPHSAGNHLCVTNKRDFCVHWVIRTPTIAPTPPRSG